MSRHRGPVVFVLRWRYTLTLLGLVVLAVVVLVPRLMADHACAERGGIPVRGRCAQPELTAP